MRAIPSRRPTTALDPMRKHTYARVRTSASRRSTTASPARSNAQAQTHHTTGRRMQHNTMGGEKTNLNDAMGGECNAIRWAERRQTTTTRSAESAPQADRERADKSFEEALAGRCDSNRGQHTSPPPPVLLLPQASLHLVQVPRNLRSRVTKEVNTTRKRVRAPTSPHLRGYSPPPPRNSLEVYLREWLLHGVRQVRER